MGWSTSQAALDLGIHIYFPQQRKQKLSQSINNSVTGSGFAFQELINMVLVLVALERNPTTSSLTAMER